ncbi:ANTAR domain-containing protein [uncultured Cellulomonas sp.]|uniref:ANTAR domain-containing protein n=1 Tax=uncultured Cellulomonas sp. TaxID=189682 RepID=UPI00262C8E8E|nr:ANTAR domain-containing protein [uncultured Cellulomonas sp.]
MTQDDARAELESLLLSTRTVREHLDDCADRAGHHLGAGTHCSVSLRHQGRDRLAATSSVRAQRCDQVEYDHGAGPCLTAMDGLQVVLVPDLLDDARWPVWRREAVDQGFRSAAAVPAHVAPGVDIALNLYSEQVDPWDRVLLTRADAYAQQVAASVALCLQVADLTERITDLQAARDAQATLDRAVGATMAHEGVGAETALARLRDRAVAEGADVRDVARALLGELGGDRAR